MIDKKLELELARFFAKTRLARKGEHTSNVKELMEMRTKFPENARVINNKIDDYIKNAK